MRKQYYFSPSDKGLLAWDVHRLVALSAKFTPFELLLTKIKELDEPLGWFNGDGDVVTAKKVALHVKLVEETDLKYPIILSKDGRVMDGMHRVCKALAAGMKSIRAVQFETDPEPDHVGVEPAKLPY